MRELGIAGRCRSVVFQGMFVERREPAVRGKL
jgi:hypothetical protein